MQVTSERPITVFKIKNRSGFAAICDDHLTEGTTEAEALDRMMKALKRTANAAAQR